MQTISTITVNTLKEWLTSQKPFTLLDVRTNEEIAFNHIPGVNKHIPMDEIPMRHQELDDNHPIVIYCHHGMRSMQVGLYLNHIGYDHIYNLQGGIHAWSQTIDPSMPIY